MLMHDFNTGSSGAQVVTFQFEGLDANTRKQGFSILFTVRVFSNNFGVSGGLDVVFT